jgi:hypothetical protein
MLKLETIVSLTKQDALYVTVSKPLGFINPEMDTGKKLFESINVTLKIR